MTVLPACRWGANKWSFRSRALEYHYLAIVCSRLNNVYVGVVLTTANTTHTRRYMARDGTSDEAPVWLSWREESGGRLMLLFFSATICTTPFSFYAFTWHEQQWAFEWLVPHKYYSLFVVVHLLPLSFFSAFSISTLKLFHLYFDLLFLPRSAHTPHT